MFPATHFSLGFQDWSFNHKGVQGTLMDYPSTTNYLQLPFEFPGCTYFKKTANIFLFLLLYTILKKEDMTVTL